MPSPASSAPHSNDFEDPRADSFTIEIWRNRVIGLVGMYRAISAFTHLLGGPYWHLYFIVRWHHEPDGEEVSARYEIYEPRFYPPHEGDWRKPVSLGGFLQRRVSGPDRPTDDPSVPDPKWGTHMLYCRNYPKDHPAAEFFKEENMAGYRWRNHYPRFYDNLHGTHVNSNTFVVKTVQELGLTNADGSAIDLTARGKFSHPGINCTEGWDYVHLGETDPLHEEWQSLHKHPSLTRRFLFLFRRRLRGRYVEPRHKKS